MTSAVPPFSTATATAPPARQTKSAECAPITCTRLGTGQPAGVRHRHRADLLLVEARLQQTVGHQRQAVLHGRVEDLAQVGREHRVLGARGADRLEDALPRDLAGVRRGEAALEERALARELDLVLDADVLRGEL